MSPTIDMNDTAIATVAQLKRFLAASKGWKFKDLSRKDKYQWSEGTVTVTEKNAVNLRNREILTFRCFDAYRAGIGRRFGG